MIKIANKTRALKMPNGVEYEFYGATYYGNCNTAASTAAKTVSISGFTSASLVQGTKITVCFDNGNTQAYPTLNVSSTGAKSLYWQGNQYNAVIPANTWVDLVYHSGYWNIVGVRQPDWYGACGSAGNTKDKTVSITGFTSANLINGTQITIRFTNAQTYNGTPTLNVSSTGLALIQSKVGLNAGQYEWQDGQVITFVYYDGAWVIEDGAHADTTYWGKTKLSNTIANDATVALTPKAVYDAGYLTLSTLPIYDGTVVSGT